MSDVATRPLETVEIPILTIRPWAENDFPLLQRLLGEPELTKYIGGPETPEQLLARHKRYTRFSRTGPGCMYVVILGEDGISAGSVGYWETEWQGQTVWECGWNVLPEFQGQGIGTRATAEIVTRARAEKKHRHLHAFPSIQNGASNAICRKAGFTLLGEVDFEYPPGNLIRGNSWQLDLFTELTYRNL